MIKILQLPASWGEHAQHWVWTAEMLARYLDKRKFEVDVTLDLYRAEEIYKDYDLIVPWYVTKVPEELPNNKAVIIAHSRFETGCLGWPESAGRGIVSKFLYDYLCGQAEPEHKIHIVNYGIDTDFWKPLQKTKSDKIRVGWVGSPDAKDFDIAEAAIKGLDVEFKPLNTHVDIRPLYGMPNYYNTIDVLLCTSLSEGFHRPTIEAMACGLPVIATRVGVTGELLEKTIDVEGWNYWWPAEKTKALKDKIIKEMREQIQDLTKAKIKKMGERNRQFVCDNWTWEKKIGAWEKLFKEAYENTKK